MACQVRTTRFGPIEVVTVPDEAVLDFPEGVPGFEAHTRFALIEDAVYAPFGWLQSLTDPAVRFVVIDPYLVVPTYELDLADQDVARLALASPDDARLLCIVTVPETVEAMTANLKAPVVVNRRSRRAVQVIRADDRYPLRHPIVADEAAPCSS